MPLALLSSSSATPSQAGTGAGSNSQEASYMDPCHGSQWASPSSRTHRLCGGMRVSRTWRMPTYG